MEGFPPYRSKKYIMGYVFKSALKSGCLGSLVRPTTFSSLLK